jgi:hypothetical protein
MFYGEALFTGTLKTIKEASLEFSFCSWAVYKLPTIAATQQLF